MNRDDKVRALRRWCWNRPCLEDVTTCPAYASAPDEAPRPDFCLAFDHRTEAELDAALEAIRPKPEGGPSGMKVELIRYTPAPAELIGEAAALCTASDDYDRARRGAMASGHLSVAEHAAFTFKVAGVSRVLLAQLTRHRLASYSVQSQRYCGVTLEYVSPQSFEEGGWSPEYNEHMERSFDLYQRMVEAGVPEEDARYVVPQSICCKLIVTMNVRELLHFLELRCCNRAQWEIRELADEMLRQAREAAPALFRGAGCACMAGKPCPEGKRSCGHPRTAEEV